MFYKSMELIKKCSKLYYFYYKKGSNGKFNSYLRKQNNFR